MTEIVSGLVRELGCVKSQVLVKNSQPKPREIHSKKGSQPLCKESFSAAARPERKGCDLLQIRVSNGLIKEGKQGLRRVA